MNRESFVIILLFSLACALFFNHKKRALSQKSNLVTRFRKNFSKKNRVRDKYKNNFSDNLMTDPESNIKMGLWEEENELREKADIHRARLSKFGRSKMNGELFFMNSKGEVYKYNKEGEKEFI